MSTIIMEAPTILAKRVAIAAPAAPRWKPKMRMALPVTFSMFMVMEAIIEIFELPIERKSAAPPP